MALSVLGALTWTVLRGRATSMQAAIRLIGEGEGCVDVLVDTGLDFDATLSWINPEAAAVLRQDTGYEPVHTLDQAVTGYIAWLRACNGR